MVRGHRDKSSVLLQVPQQPLPSVIDYRPPDPLVYNIRPSPQAQILGAEYNPGLQCWVKDFFLAKCYGLNAELLTLLVRIGVHPKVFSDRMHTSVSNLVQHGKFH